MTDDLEWPRQLRAGIRSLLRDPSPRPSAELAELLATPGLTPAPPVSRRTKLGSRVAGATLALKIVVGTGAVAAAAGAGALTVHHTHVFGTPGTHARSTTTRSPASEPRPTPSASRTPGIGGVAAIPAQPGGRPAGPGPVTGDGVVMGPKRASGDEHDAPTTEPTEPAELTQGAKTTTAAGGGTDDSGTTSSGSGSPPDDPNGAGTVTEGDDATSAFGDRSGAPGPQVSE